MKIIKFGGAALSSIERFYKMLDIVNQEKDNLLIVVSAFSKSTSNLKKAAFIAQSGKLIEANDLLAYFENEYLDLAENLISDTNHFQKLNNFFSQGINRLTELLKGIWITKEVSPRTLDNILSFGESFALATIDCFFKQHNIDHHCVDSSNIILTDNNYGAAKPLFNETKANVKTILLPLINKNKIVITQGFVAKNILGEITTMGMESSNLTAVLYAALLELNEVTFWTDVDGIHNADPKTFQNTSLIHNLDFDTALEYSKSGLNLVFPDMLEIAKNYSIKLVFKSVDYPNNNKSEIFNNLFDFEKPVLLVKRNLTYSEIDENIDKSRFNETIKSTQTQNTFLFSKIDNIIHCLVQSDLINNNSLTNHNAIAVSIFSSSNSISNFYQDFFALVPNINKILLYASFTKKRVLLVLKDLPEVNVLLKNIFELLNK